MTSFICFTVKNILFIIFLPLKLITYFSSSEFKIFSSDLDYSSTASITKYNVIRAYIEARCLVQNYFLKICSKHLVSNKRIKEEKYVFYFSIVCPHPTSAFSICKS